jgi:hypothetical protein
MRQDCKQFESRTYRNGETVRKCNLDLAPEAPWRCPADCPRYERRMADVNWSHGTLVTPATPDEPLDALDRGDDSVARLLDEAEEIINTAGPQIMSEVQIQRSRRPRRRAGDDGGSRWKRWLRRRDD